jgi:hypothetical protein
MSPTTEATADFIPTTIARFSTTIIFTAHWRSPQTVIASLDLPTAIA